MLSAGIGEISACLVRVPTEIVKQRMQTGKYSHFTNALKDIYGKQRLRGFYVGYFTTVSREIPFSFIQFPIWERLKTIWSEYQFNHQRDIAPWQAALCGSVAGSISAAVTTPLDVIKTRLMLQVDAHGKPYHGFWNIVSRVHAEEGSLGFFKGIAPRVTWIFIGGFFFFGAYEKSKSVLRPWWDY
ncbi:hypothetical protein RFI_24242 [Reticulomyxa filosa]|uniref:Uncharacterized protein n=1 Tax=Reticulomyxa filosa TaxID=46433 RepID=X6MI71_RETFI|nr:hypothetical protein RFI_24242 [Reticulomyxa filosa]|eukprot:ETO13132.1 hypothetical protein RFI_24242 [Reticulomyxa filosa]